MRRFMFIIFLSITLFSNLAIAKKGADLIIGVQSEFWGDKEQQKEFFSPGFGGTIGFTRELTTRLYTGWSIGCTYASGKDTDQKDFSNYVSGDSWGLNFVSSAHLQYYFLDPNINISPIIGAEVSYHIGIYYLAFKDIDYPENGNTDESLFTTGLSINPNVGVSFPISEKVKLRAMLNYRLGFATTAFSYFINNFDRTTTFKNFGVNLQLLVALPNNFSRTFTF